ncbi:MAG TPA: PAS domain-containing protein, partial [Methylobacterium sp.]
MRGLRLLDASSDPNLDAICRIAAHTFAVPIATVTFVGARAVRLKARIGIDARVLPRDATICNHALAQGGAAAFVIRDLPADPRFRDLAMVRGEPGARFYAGVPIALGDGSPVGTLAILDTVARPDFSQSEVRVLEDLASIVQAHLRLHEATVAGQAEAEARLRSQGRVLAEREARLAEAGKVQRAAEEATQVGHWRIDAATRGVFWSAGIARIFGRNLADHVVGIADHVAFYHPEDRAKVARCIEEGLANDEESGDRAYEHRSRLIRPDGETRIVKVRGAVQRDAEGRVEATVGICIDVTEAARAEAQARETTALLRATLENIDQGLVMVRADGRICVHNRRLAELLDLPDAVLAGEPTFAALRRHQLARSEFVGVEPALGAALGALAIEAEPHLYTYTRPDGRIVEVATMPLDGGGAVQTCTDVTARRRAERLIGESEERHRVFAESLPQMVWTRRYSDGEATYTNEQFRTFYGPIGPSAEARIARYHPDDAARILAAWDEARAGASSAKVLGRLRRQDGVYRWHKIVVTALQRDGRFAEWLATALDIDDLMNAREELENKTQLLDLAQNAAGAGLWQWNMAEGTLWVSRAGAALLGLPIGADDAAGITLPLEDVHAAVVMSDVGDLDAEVRRGIETRAPVVLQFRAKAGNGRYRWIQSFGQVVFDTLTDQPVRMVGLHLDITEQKDAACHIEHDAKHDALTGLPNRSLFRATLDASLVRVRTEGGSLAVMCLDLDRFKR